MDELEASGQFQETFFSALTNGQSPSKLKASLEEAKNNTPFVNSQDAKVTAFSTAKDKIKKKAAAVESETLTKQMQRLQQERRLKEGIDVTKDEEEEEEEEKKQDAKKTTRKRFSFGYITLQVILQPFRTFWFYIMATMTQSQERYQQINQHKKRTRQQRLVEPVMEFINIACLVQERPILQWAWQMLAMFFWPLIRVFGGGLLIDKFLEQTVLHLLSEDHVVFYLRLGSDLLWPDGVFIQRADPPTPLQREQMRVRAERLLTISIPGKIKEWYFDRDANVGNTNTNYNFLTSQYKRHFI